MIGPRPQAAAGLTRGTLLGGRVRYAQQPAPAFRSGLEPVLLAASIPARPGARVLEAGCGAGAAILCLAARVAVRGIAADLDPAVCAVARDNFRDNGASILAVRADIGALPATGMDHAFANPPYHGPGTASPHAARERAKRGGAAEVAAWCAALLRAVRPGGTASVIVPAGQVASALAGFAQGGHHGGHGRRPCPAAITLTPIWPREHQPARFVIVMARAGGRTPLRLLSGLVLHRAGGAFTPHAAAVLAGAAALVSSPQRRSRPAPSDTG